MGKPNSLPWLGNAISSIGSLLSGVLFSSNQLRQQREAQKWNQHVLDTQIRENLLDRNFNAAQAELNRNFQSQMVDKANRFNSIQNQVGQLRAAGLNPALAYSGNNFVPMSVPSGSSASHSGNVSSSSYPIVDAGSIALQGLRQMAEIKNIEAQTRKLDTEGSILESDAKFRDALNSSQLNLNNVSILLSESGIDVNDAQIANLRASTNLFQKKVDNLDYANKLIESQTAGSNLDNVRKSIENQYKSKEYEALIDNIASQTSKNRADVYRTLTLTPAELSNIKSDTTLKSSMSKVQSALFNLYGLQADNLKMQNGILSLDLRHADNEQKMMDSLGKAGDGLDAATRYLSTLLGNFIPGLNSIVAGLK
jgi:hypothetical protein|nr:MAG TPA: minor capsid protein [Microviridae sp.]